MENTSSANFVITWQENEMFIIWTKVKIVAPRPHHKASKHLTHMNMKLRIVIWRSKVSRWKVLQKHTHTHTHTHTNNTLQFASTYKCKAKIRVKKSNLNFMNEVHITNCCWSWSPFHIAKHFDFTTLKIESMS